MEVQFPVHSNIFATDTACEMEITSPTSRVIMSGYVMMNIDRQNDTTAPSTRNRSEYGTSPIAWTERMVTDG